MGVGDLLHLVGQYGYLAAFFMLKGGLRKRPGFSSVRQSLSQTIIRPCLYSPGYTDRSGASRK